MKQIFNSNAADFLQSSAYLERPRLHRLLKDAMDYPLVVVCAGAGYGKTHAVHSFLRNYGAHVTWFQVSERDNLATRYWERYTSLVSLAWPEAGPRLAAIGFPETEEAFSQYSAMVHEASEMPQKQVMVLDDFHLLHNAAVLRFIERAAGMLPSNTTVVLISRATPDFNLIGMMMRGRVFTIQEDTLRFTEDEIDQYFNQLTLPVSRGDLRAIYDDTRGWSFAVHLIGRSLAKEQKYERYALEAMKTNIFRLIHREVSQTVSEPLWRLLLRISLIDHLAASLVKTLAEDEALIRELDLLNAYVRYDFQLDTYMIHHLFLDYLRQNQGQLTEEEKKETYQAAGLWSDTNGQHMDALSYFEKSGDYVAVMRIAALLNAQAPQDMKGCALEMLDRAPKDVKAQNPLFPAVYMKLKTSLGRLDEAAEAARRFAGDYEGRPPSPLRYRALAAIYAHWGILRMLMCTCTDAYDFDGYYQKMGECYDRDPFPVISDTSVSIIAWASLVGTSRAGAQEEYMAALSRSIPITARVANGVLLGFDDLARGELCFYQGDFSSAEQCLKQSVDKANACRQHVTRNRALVYLMQIAFFRGDFAAATRWLEAMEAMLGEKDFGIRYAMYDIACGFYQLALEQPELLPEWLKGDFSPYRHPSFLENYANRVKAQYHFQTRRYSALLAFIENEMEQQSILLGKIGLKVLQALSLYRLKRRGEAISALTEAYFLSESNQIIEPFIQYAKDMRTLSAAAAKDESCPIPRAWLENVNRKASAFAKRKAKLFSDCMTAHQREAGIPLTARESDILRDLSHGLSRSEIAASQNISVNTVKMAVNMIYEKLHAHNLPNAIRIATDRKMI